MTNWYLIGWENMSIEKKLLWMLKTNELILTYNDIYEKVFLVEETQIQGINLIKERSKELQPELEKLIETGEFLKFKKKHSSDVYYGYINSRNIRNYCYFPIYKEWSIVLPRTHCHNLGVNLTCSHEKNKGKKYRTPCNISDYLPESISFPKCKKKDCPIKELI